MSLCRSIFIIDFKYGINIWLPDGPVRQWCFDSRACAAVAGAAIFIVLRAWPWAAYLIHTISGCACAGNAGVTAQNTPNPHPPPHPPAPTPTHPSTGTPTHHPHPHHSYPGGKKWPGPFLPHQGHSYLLPMMTKWPTNYQNLLCWVLSKYPEILKSNIIITPGHKQYST